MWRYTCPICGEKIEENKTQEMVKSLMRYSHKCPNCNGMLYVADDGTCLDLGQMLVRALELNTGIILSKEEALSYYIEV